MRRTTQFVSVTSLLTFRVHSRAFFYKRLIVLTLFISALSCSKSNVSDGSNHPSANDSLQMADMLYQKGMYYQGAGNDSLLWVANRLIDLGKAINDERIQLNGLLLKARYTWRSGDYPAAMKVVTSALQKAELHGFTEAIPDLCGIMGNLYKENEDFPHALEIADRGLMVALSLKDTTRIIKIMLNKSMFTHSWGIRNNDNEMRKKALDSYFEGLALAESSPDFEILRIPYYNNISQYYKIERDFPNGLLFAGKAEALAKKHHRLLSLTYTYNWMGELYFYNEDRKKGLSYLQQALDIARDQHAPFRESELYRVLYHCYLEENEPHKALDAFRRSVAINDSLQLIKTARQIGQLQLEYETEKKDQRIVSLNAMNLEKTRRTRLMGGGMILFLLLSTFLLILYRGIRKRNRLLAYNNEKIREQSEKLSYLMKELHHRVKNNLQIVSSLLSIQSNHLTDRDARQAVKVGQQRIEAMSLIHRSLYMQNNPNMVNMNLYVTDLVENILQCFEVDKKRFDLQLDIQIAEMDVDRALPLGLIINEWVTNAFKYAYKEILFPALSLSLKKDREIILKIKDNGPGIPQEIWDKPQYSFGLKLVKILSKQLHGSYQMENQDGTTLYLHIPLRVNSEG